MDHQDFQPVVIKKTNRNLTEKKQQQQQTETLNKLSRNTLLENKLEKEESIQLVSSSLKTKFINNRVAAKLSQQQLAQRINRPVDKIKSLEQGKLQHKEAVQICRFAEKVIGKIL